MDKLTIGFFNDSFYPLADGVIMVMDNYAKRLCKDNNVIVFVPRYHKKFDDSKLPYKVVRCRSIKVPFLDYSLPLPLLDRKYRKVLKNSNLDIVHIHSPFSIGYTGLRYAKKHKIKQKHAFPLPRPTRRCAPLHSNYLFLFYRMMPLVTESCRISAHP